MRNVCFAAPDPPSNLTVSVRNGKTAIVYWSPPAQGNYSGFRLRVQSFSDTGNPKTSVIPADAVPYVLRDLIPGATYSLQLFTVLDTKESVAYTSRNFTTSESIKRHARFVTLPFREITNATICLKNKQRASLFYSCRTQHTGQVYRVV